MELDESKLRQYEEEGYTTVQGLISTAEAAAVRKRLLELLEGEHDWPDLHFQILDPVKFRNARGTGSCRSASRGPPDRRPSSGR